MTNASEPLLTPESVFRDYAPRVYNVARRMLNNDADAEDVTQEVLLQVVRKLDTFRGESAFPTWLHRVTVNAALAVRRKRAKHDEGRIYDPLDNFTEEGHHHGFVRPWPKLPESPILEQEQRQLLDQAIAALPDMYRDVLVLADIENLSNAEIGTLLDLTVSAVKSRLHRARLLVRDAVTKYFEERL